MKKLHPLSQTTLLLISLSFASIFLINHSLASHHPTFSSTTNNNAHVIAATTTLSGGSVVAGSGTTTGNSTSYIKECCSTTTYPNLCYETLATYATQIQTNPKLISTKSLSVALNAAQNASKTISRLSRLRHRLKSNEATALSDCTMAVAHSQIQLQRSLEEMEGRRVSEEPEMVVSDVETWTSAALTYEEACMEEFEGREMKGNVRILVRREIWKLTQLTSNALALIHHVLAKEIGKKRH